VKEELQSGKEKSGRELEMVVGDCGGCGR